MRLSLASSGLLLITALAPAVDGLQALVSSPCAVSCGNILGSTSGDELTCFDDSYGTTKGLVFQNCISCLVSSKYVDPISKQTDLQWALYNLRYAISWCLFGYPNNKEAGDTPCTTSTACGPLEAGIEMDSLSPNASTYSYCGLLLESHVPNCHACLSQQSKQFYLTNMLTVLNGACTQQPTAGNTVSLEGTIFSNEAMNVTDPTKAHVSSFNPNKGGLSLGAKVGIAIAAILAVLSIAGCCIICFGRRRRRKALAEHQQKSGYTTWLAQQKDVQHQSPSMARAEGESRGIFHDSPQSQRPLVQGHLWGGPPSAVEESPASAMGEKVYFSPYSSQYSSPVSAHDQVQPMGRDWSLDRKGSIAGLGRSRSREKQQPEIEMDRIEVQNIAPVLLHPGHGRGRADLSPQDDDWRRNAV